MGALLSSFYNPYLQYKPVKRKVFISYHHKEDQFYADWLKDGLSGVLDVFTDRSLDQIINSNNPHYVNRKIREDYIKGSSVTVVLFGRSTPGRKYVDWEIASTLHHQHALLGIVLPTAQKTFNNEILVPSRFADNFRTGYAVFGYWNHDLWAHDPSVFVSLIEKSLKSAENKMLINNSRNKMERNVI